MRAFVLFIFYLCSRLTNAMIEFRIEDRTIYPQIYFNILYRNVLDRSIILEQRLQNRN